jgi:protein-S-isoprenylcysteine O-methyltransferase Ste14
MIKMGGLELKVPPPFVLLIVGLLMWLVNYLMGGAFAPRFAFFTGIEAMAIGFAIAVRGLITLRRNHTTPSPIMIDRAKKLVTTGLYRFSRNPIYLGMVIFLVGVAVMFGNLWLLAGPLAFGFYINRFQIMPEERAMTAKFGSDYTDYKSRVRRWI